MKIVLTGPRRGNDGRTVGTEMIGPLWPETAPSTLGESEETVSTGDQSAA